MKGEWYVNLQGKAQGIFTYDQVSSLIRTGKVSKGCLVWKKGFVSWEPIELHFKLEQTQEIQQSSPPAKPSELTSSAGQIAPQSPALILLSLLLTIASIAGFFWVKNSSETLQDTSTLTFNWFAVLALSVVCAGFCLCLTWKHSNTLWSDKVHQRRAGFLKLGCCFGTIGLVIYTGVFGYAGLTLIQISKARSAYNKYTIDVDPASNVLTISGLIGPDLSRQIIDKLKVHSDIQTILIDSPGGLIDEGLSAARYIEALANSTVIAQGTCNSSCLLILMSAKNRLASWNMDLGFHAASAITNLNADYKELGYDFGDESYAYLIKRGVPTNIIEQAKAKGASQLEVVPAIDLFDSGVLTNLVDGDKIIDAKSAKWRFIEDVLSGSESSNWLSVLIAVRESDKSLVEKYASPLYFSLRSKDSANFRKLVSELTNSITQRAFKAAEGSVLNAYMTVQYLQIQHLAKLEQWKACVDYSNQRIDEAESFISKELLRKEFDALAKLIRSASENHWKDQPIPSWIESTTEPMYKEVMRKAVEMGLIDEEGKYRDDKAQCIYLYMIWDEILGLDEDTAAPVVRSILTE